MSEDLIDNDLEDLQQFRDLNALSGDLADWNYFFVLPAIGWLTKRLWMLFLNQSYEHCCQVAENYAEKIFDHRYIWSKNKTNFPFHLNIIL